MGSKMFYTHALKLEHAQYALPVYVHAYWLQWAEPTPEGCSVCMPIVITNFKARGVKQDSIPYMAKIVFTHISIEFGVVDHNVYGFLNSSS